MEPYTLETPNGRPRLVSQLHDLTEAQRARVVEVIAWQVHDILRRAVEEDPPCKSYDPLSIEEVDRVVLSYSYDLFGGGRSNTYENLDRVLAEVRADAVRMISNYIEWLRDE